MKWQLAINRGCPDFPLVILQNNYSGPNSWGGPNLRKFTVIIIITLLIIVGIFPEADKDAVIQIANMVKRQGDPKPMIRTIFTLNTCAPIVGSQVLSHKTESEMLRVTICFCHSDSVHSYMIQIRVLATRPFLKPKPSKTSLQDTQIFWEVNS